MHDLLGPDEVHDAAQQQGPFITPTAQPVQGAHQFLDIHLPDQTIVFDAAGSQAIGQPVWFFLRTSVVGLGQWAVSDAIWAYDRWNVGKPDATDVGYLDKSIATHWG